MCGKLDRVILITGAAGFIGRHVVKQYLNSGQAVVVLARRRGVKKFHR
jgi:uncharacterized protein YbjT (DUF2867 family)